MRVFLELSYDGTHYHGWQRQPECTTVQEVLEGAMERLFGQSFSVMGCGRTDTGVHARYFVAHTVIDDEVFHGRVSSMQEATMKLNGMLPKDIGLKAMHQVGAKAHARFDAVERSYAYHVHSSKDPFLEGKSTRIFGELNLEAMQEAAAHLVQKGDFASFCKAGTGQGTTICDVREARWEQNGTHQWAFHISADRFLRNMVRAVVGTLLEVGRGKRTPESMVDVLAAAHRSAAGKSVLGCGLYLTKVIYPPEVFSPSDEGYL